MMIPETILTRRLRLHPATEALARAELCDPSAFSEQLSAVVSEDWPPRELADARVFFLCMLEANPTLSGWLGWYAVDRGSDEQVGGNDSSGVQSPFPPTLIGSAGFKGPPDKNGEVEVGYSVLPAHQGRGFATEMVEALLRWAREHGARLVQAQTVRTNRASVRVLEKLGFSHAGAGHEPEHQLYLRRLDDPDSDALPPADPESGESPDGRDTLERIHRDADERTRVLEAIHRGRLRCGLGCCFCCVDEITVFELEADRIREHHAALLAHGEPNPPGACAFLDGAGACRVYEDRPYVCRTQGLPLRWEDEGPDGEPVEFRDICPVNEAGTPVEELAADDCWTIGPIEERLAALQAARDGGNLTRVRLRDLFLKSRPV